MHTVQPVGPFWTNQIQNVLTVQNCAHCTTCGWCVLWWKTMQWFEMMSQNLTERRTDGLTDKLHEMLELLSETKNQNFVIPRSILA